MPSISNKQWGNICSKMIGLRSGTSNKDLKGASYAMDCGVKPMAPPPADWDELLAGTIRYMMGFDSYQDRYLLIVRKSTATGEKYSGTFPKCSSYPTECLASVQFGQNSEADLVKWVISAIPD